MKREFPIVSAEVEAIITARAINLNLDEFVEQFGELGPAFLQCGKITGYLPNGVTLCGKPMLHDGDCE